MHEQHKAGDLLNTKAAIVAFTNGMPTWPRTVAQLVAEQEELARATPPAWQPQAGALALGGCFACFPRGVHGRGARGDRGWAAATVLRGGRVVARAVVSGVAGAPYEPGLLALREGPLLEAAVRAMPVRADILLVDATGRDHPRRAGLALHLGAVLDLPTVGVTHRALVAEGPWPADQDDAASPLRIGDELVGHWLRTRPGTRPVAVHAAWCTDPDTALAVVRAAVSSHRTPEPIRVARTLARETRAQGRAL